MGEKIMGKRLRKRKFLLTFIFLFFSSFYVFCAQSVSNANLTIDAYKPDKQLEVGRLDIKVFSLGTTSEISGYNMEFDVTTSLETATSRANAMDAFSITIETNLGNNFNFKIQVEPFVNQKDNTKKATINYIFSNSSEWNNIRGSGNGNNRIWYRYMFNATIENDEIQVVAPVTNNMTLNLKAQSGKGRNANQVSFSDYQFSHGSVLPGTNSSVSSTINAKIWMASEDYNNIQYNVKYSARVIVTVEII